MKKSLIGRLLVLTALMLALLVCLTGCGKNDPTEWLSVTFSGVDGQGTVQVELDLDTMAAVALGKTETDMETWDDVQDYMVLYESLSKGITIDITPSSELSNGDKVTVSISCEGVAADHFKNKKSTYTAEGLVTAVSVDPFSYMEVSYDGISGNATLQLKNTATEAGLSAIEFTASPQSKLASGDTVEITASLDETYTKTYGYVLEKTSTSITVPQLASLVEDPSRIPWDVVKTLVDYVAPEYTYESSDSLQYEAPQYFGSYFVTYDEGSTLFGTRNALEVYISYRSWWYGSEDITYVNITLTDLVCDTEGNIVFSLDDVDHVEDRYFENFDTVFAGLKERGQCQWYPLEFS